MWIVRLALRRPYTFVVASLLVFILGALTIIWTPKDIFPDVNIPVISVIFNYSGMPADDMEQRVISGFERFLTTTVNDIEHTESQSLSGVAVVKIFFQPTANIQTAIAQVTAICQTAIRQMPPGTQPPLVIQYSASDVPILQLSFGSDSLSEQAMYDVATNRIRPALVTVPGVQIPGPYGGKQRQIMVDLEPDRLYAWGISANDVSNAIADENIILPAGVTKIGTQEYPVRINSSPDHVEELNNLPIKTVNGIPVYIKDVAHVRDGFQVQNSFVHTDGKRGVLISILKSGGASTLDVVAGVKKILAGIDLPPGLKVTPLFDQSLYVRASIEGVEREAAIAAGLTALMILVFLGSWRSTVVVVTSIPLSILASIIIMSALGETLNVMTLGGLALAVGILVDDATVAIENIHRNLHQQKRLVVAILDGSAQIAVPAFVSTLCICIVFVPIGFISGPARSLFVPLGMAVVFAMLTSYVLSRTLVPTMVHYLLASEVEIYGGKLDPNDPHAHSERAAELDPHRPHPHVGVLASLIWTLLRLGLVIGAIAIIVGIIAVLPDSWRGAITDKVPTGLTQSLSAIGQNPAQEIPQILQYLAIAFLAVATLRYIMQNQLIWKFHEAFNRVFEKIRRFYGGLLAWGLDHAMAVLVGFIILVLGSVALTPLIGQDFFPTVDAGQLRLHVRGLPGTRLEQSERNFSNVEDAIRKDIPPAEIDTMLDNIGIPNSGINLSLSDGSLMSPADGEILISLKPGHAPTEHYMVLLDKDLHEKFPDLTFFFAPADIVTQVLNFGIAAPIDIQVEGSIQNEDKDLAIAHRIQTRLASIPGAADIRMEQVPRTPDLRINVDRTLASEVGVSQRDVASDMLISLSGTAQANPNFWLDHNYGVEYSVLVQAPQYSIDTISQLENLPIIPPAETNQSQAQLLGNLSELQRGSSATNITHYNIRPTYDVLAGVRGRDLGSVANAVRGIVADEQRSLPAGSRITVRGQVQSMTDSFNGLTYGLIFAVILVYLLMVINFQSWLDPMIILMALPGALAGILWALFVTGTTINVPSLMGAIMSIGVATANSILIVTFANDQRKEGMNARDAALAAGLTRLRPVIMTALAMIIGMFPMALGMGEGGEQNAPLGRAVIGGLIVATFATLLFVPVVYSKLRSKPIVTQVEEELK